MASFMASLRAGSRLLPERQADSVEAVQLRPVDQSRKVALLRGLACPHASQPSGAILKAIPCEGLQQYLGPCLRFTPVAAASK